MKSVKIASLFESYPTLITSSMTVPNFNFFLLSFYSLFYFFAFGIA